MWRRRHRAWIVYLWVHVFTVVEMMTVLELLCIPDTALPMMHDASLVALYHDQAV